MNYVIGRNVVPLVYDGKLMGFDSIPLPPRMLRFQFEDPDYDPTTVTSWKPIPGSMWYQDRDITWKSGSYWVKVQGTEENRWDWYCDDPNWELAFDYAFADESNRVQVIAGNTDGITNMKGIFRGCRDITFVCMLDTSDVTNMDLMFAECRKLEGIPFFDTSNVTSMWATFYQCFEITSVPLFDTSKVTNMREMFEECRSLTTVPLFDTSRVTRMDEMFLGCRSLTSVPLFDTSRVYNMWGMFWGCSAITTVPLFDTHEVQYMTYMLYQCTSLTQIPLFATEHVIDMDYMCKECVNVAGGAFDLYQQASSQSSPPRRHNQTFRDCGINTPGGRADLLGIPQDWQ